MYFRPLHTVAYTFAIGLGLFFLLRVLDISFNENIQNWTFHDYFRVLATMKHKSHHSEKEHSFTFSTSMRHWFSVPDHHVSVSASRRNRWYYVGFVMYCTFQYTLLNILLYIRMIYPVPMDRPVFQFLSFDDFPRIWIHNYIACVILYLGMNQVHCISFHFLAEIFRVDFDALMYCPFASSSVREYWSFRWNTFVKVSSQFNLRIFNIGRKT